MIIIIVVFRFFFIFQGHKEAIASKIAFTRANVRCLCVHSAAEALLLMLNSNRVNEDLQMMVKLSTLKDEEILTQVSFIFLSFSLSTFYIFF